MKSKGKKRNNAVGVKGKSGRKTDAEIIRKYIDTDLANKIANKELKRIDNEQQPDRDDMKVIVMPVVTKNMTEKKEHSGSIELKQITGMKIHKDKNGD